MVPLLKLFISLCLLCVAIVSSANAPAPGHVSGAAATDTNLNVGYSVLRLFLEDEQHLTTIRRVKAVIQFKGISEASRQLIDDIASLAATTLSELEQLAAGQPVIDFIEFSDDEIGKATLDSLRFTITREFLFDNAAFEKNLLLSQAQALRVISHLARQLAEQDSSSQRKAWLRPLAEQYETLYTRVLERIALA